MLNIIYSNVKNIELSRRQTKSSWSIVHASSNEFIVGFTVDRYLIDKNVINRKCSTAVKPYFFMRI